MKKSHLYFANLIISILGLLTIIFLVSKQIIIGNICPPLFEIPACFIILILLVLIILSHIKIFKDRNMIYFLCAILGLLIAIYFSFSQIRGLQDCPQCLIGIPLCYLSVLMFTLLLILKILEIKFQTGEKNET